MEEELLPERSSFGELLGSSLRMRRLYAQLERVAATDASVLIEGESGTGKEEAARAIASAGQRAGGPFVVLDCGALPPTLAEDELFGHERGAFTGADAVRQGAFERAHTGTLFLDEIGELPLELQTRLLGALERKEVQRLGSSARTRVDVRVIAATHRHLENEVNRGTFRADLFYRLSVLGVAMPALREHREDVPELVAHFVKEAGGELSPRALERLYQGEFRGNVRELRNAVQRALAGLDPGNSGLGRLRVSVDPRGAYHEQKAALLEAFDESYLTQLLALCGGNLSEAARRSGVNRGHLHGLYQRLKSKG